MSTEGTIKVTFYKTEIELANPLDELVYIYD